jgi:antirestriction protein ArdC
MASQSELRQQITNQIVDALKNDLIPWRRPWINHENAGLASNVVSKRRYQGVNAILLGLMSMDQGYQSKHWATFRQWKMLGGSVKRGEMGMRIVSSQASKASDFLHEFRNKTAITHEFDEVPF